MPDSLERLDLLLLTVPKSRRVHQDGIRFMGLRYIDPTLAAYVGEDVVLRYDPRDMAEIRVFYHDRFLCRAICQELAGETVALARSSTPAIAGGESCARRSESAAAWLIRCSRPNALRRHARARVARTRDSPAHREAQAVFL